MTKPWPKHREVIHELYKKQGKSLEETMKIMETQHGFKASTRTYRTKFKKWGWTKYNKRPQSDDGIGSRQLDAVPSYEAPMMTPGPSSEGASAMNVSAMVRASNSPSSSPAFRSSEMDYSSVRLDPCRGSSQPSSQTLFTSPYSNHRVDQQTYLDSMQQNFGCSSAVQGSQSAQPNGGAFGFTRAYDHVQQQQQMGSFRPILPAQQHHGEHRNLHIETGTVESSAYRAFLSPTLSASSPVHPIEQLNSSTRNTQPLRENGKLVKHSSFANACYLTSFEQYIQEFVSWGNGGTNMSPGEVYDFCRNCAIFVQHSVDLSRVVPPNFEHTIRRSLALSDPVAVIQTAVLNHQQQLQHDQRNGGLVVPSWVSLWAWACQQSLNGSMAALDESFTALSYYSSDSIDIHSLRSLLPRHVSPTPYCTPQSSSNQQHDQSVWDQQE